MLKSQINYIQLWTVVWTQKRVFYDVQENLQA